MNIVYLHGFGSDCNSFKGKAIEKEYPDHTVSVPDIPVNPLEAIKYLTNYFINIDLTSDEPILLIGTSLGGFYADYFSRLMDLNAILINPLVDVVPIKQLVGKNTFINTGIEYDFTPYDYKELTRVSKWKNKLRPSLKKVQILLAKDDELIPYNTTKLYYQASNQFIKVFDEGGHRFTNLDAIFHSINNMFYE